WRRKMLLRSAFLCARARVAGRDHERSPHCRRSVTRSAQRWFRAALGLCLLGLLFLAGCRSGRTRGDEIMLGSAKSALGSVRDVDNAPHVIRGAVSASWSCPAPAERDDFVGLYASPDAGNYEYVNFHYLCPYRRIDHGPCGTPMSDGNLALGIPFDVTPGTYELRIVSLANMTL